MFTLKYYESKERTPKHNSNISFYVLNKTCYLTKSLAQQFANVTYDWNSDCGEVSEYYNPETEGHYKVGDTRTSTWFSDDENEGHRTVRLTMCFDVAGERTPSTLWGNLPEEIPNIAWNYTHEIERELSTYMGENYFPCFDINNLLREGVIKMHNYDKVLVGAVGNQWYHIYGSAKYKGKMYHLFLSQHAKWKEDDWTEDGGFGEVDVVQWKILDNIK